MISFKCKIGRWSVLLFTLWAIFLQFSLPAQALEISVEPMNSEIAEQETIALDIYANSSILLISMGVKISFDPAVLNVVSASKNVDFINGFILDADGDSGTISDQYSNPPVDIDNTSGSITMLGGRLIGSSTSGLSGKVLLGSIVFKGVQVGSSNISVDLAKYHPEHPVKTFDNFVNIDGSVDEPTNLGNMTVITVSGPCIDIDGDGYGDPGNSACANGPERDCNDNVISINPGAAEVCNGVDDDCDGTADEGCDLDGDGIFDNGDGSGVVGDNPCTGGETANCDDNCANIQNPNQEDLDGDGFGDVCDNCSNDHNKTNPGICGCGKSDTDSDGDGTPDCIDCCPDDPNETDLGACSFGIINTIYYKDEDNDGYGTEGDYRCLTSPDEIEKYTAIYSGDQDDLDPNIQGTIFTGNMSIPSGWSMISLPLNPDNASVLSVLPDAVVVYSYEKGKGYVRIKPEENMEVEKGYWILLNDAKTYSISGEIIDGYNLSVEDGWYMIGGCTLDAKALGDKCNIGVIYGYEKDSGYKRVQESKNLKPAKGYWILLSNVNEQAHLNVGIPNIQGD